MQNCAAPRADECASRFLRIRRPGSSPRTHRHGPKLVLPSHARCGSFPLRRLESRTPALLSTTRAWTVSKRSPLNAANCFPALFPSATRFGSILVETFSLVPLRLADLRTENLAPPTPPPDSSAFRPPHSASRTASQTPRIVSLHSGGSKTGRDRRTCFFTFQPEVTTASVRPSDPNTKLAEITS